jgi:glycosyltransferase involved in cell wall biosynthesis
MTETCENLHEPRVSVVIPAYNAAWCIRRAVDSVQAQDFRDLELIVVDDGSSDATAEILATYGSALTLVRQANGGLSNARNRGIAQARGRYVAFLDADDWWLPGKLSRQVALLDNRADVMFCSTTTSVVTAEGGSLPDWRCGPCEDGALACIFQVNAFVAGSGSSVMARREVFERTGGFDETLRSLEDIDMWMRLAAVGSYACIDEALTVIEKRGDSMSGNRVVMRAAAIRVMQKNRHLLPVGRQRGFWRAAYASMLSDYAKWAYRQGRRSEALLDLLHGLALAPLSRGRPLAGLLLAMLLRQDL